MFVPAQVRGLPYSHLLSYGALPAQGSPAEAVVLSDIASAFGVVLPRAANITQSHLCDTSLPIIHPEIASIVANDALPIPLRVALRLWARRSCDSHPIFDRARPPNFGGGVGPSPRLCVPLHSRVHIRPAAVAALFSYDGSFKGVAGFLHNLSLFGCLAGARPPAGALRAPVRHFNHKSCLRLAPLVLRAVQREVRSGQVLELPGPPPVGCHSSPIAALLKSSGEARILSDRSYPAKDVGSFNAWVDMAAFPPLTLFGARDFARLVQSYRAAAGCPHQAPLRASALAVAQPCRDAPPVLMAKVDLTSAYRFLSVSPSEYHLSLFSLRVRGRVRHFVDTQLSMGSSSSCVTFEAVTASVAALARLAGFACTAYLDDHLIVGGPDSALAGWIVVQLLLLSLHFSISVSKSPPPSTKMPALGILIDSSTGSATLPLDSWRKLRSTLAVWLKTKRASLAMFRRLHGLLNWLATVHSSLRPLLFHFRTALAWRNRRCTTFPHVKTRVPPRILADLRVFMRVACAQPVATLIPPTVEQAHVVVYTDACFDGSRGGYGAYCEDLSLYISGWFDDSVLSLGPHITLLETMVACFALAVVSRHMPPHSCILLRTDCSTTHALVCRLSSPSAALQRCARALVSQQLHHHHYYTSKHVAGTSNFVADDLSRGKVASHIASTCTQIRPTARDWKSLLYSSRRR